MSTYFLGLLFVLMAALGPLCQAADSCGSERLGVKELREKNDVRTVSTVRVPVDAKDVEAVHWAGEEAEMRAKEQLLRFRKKQKVTKGTLKGVILRRSCISGNYLYSTIETSESLRRQSSSLKRQIDESLRRSPTPTAR